MPLPWLGSWEEAAIPINHKPCWLDPAGYFTCYKQGQGLSWKQVCPAIQLPGHAHKARERIGSSSLFNLLLVIGFPPACRCGITLPSVRFFRMTEEAKNFHQALNNPVKTSTEHRQGWVKKNGPCSCAADTLFHALGKGYVRISSTSPELFRKWKPKLPWTSLFLFLTTISFALMFPDQFSPQNNWWEKDQEM